MVGGSGGGHQVDAGVPSNLDATPDDNEGGGGQAGQLDPGGAGGQAGTSEGGAPAAGHGGKEGEASSGGCPADMAAVEGFCIDRYEAPNQLGALPLAMQTAQDGEAWCQERGKRLCTEAEWLRACEGSTKRTYPYGDVYEPHRCNDDKTWIPPNWGTLATWPSEAAKTEAAKLYQADPSGARAGCVSEDGVYDLTGNVAEWVVRSFPTQKNYEHVLKGCYWSKCYGGSNPSCLFVNGAHPGHFRTYEAGFRCCLGPLP
ncbi:MAG: formylglycine-generating enzyme family protein [Polyangiaceae bacterium]|nr:formylglycine-generating enzyme family protein [Polyangiaceae bacterium]